MKKKNIIIIIISSLLVIITALIFILSKINIAYDIILSSECSKCYSEEVLKNYKAKVEDSSKYSNYYDSAKAIEMDEYRANLLLESGRGKKFIPFYNIKTILVKNNKDAIDINSLNELKDSNYNISFHNANTISSLISYMSISYSLYGNYNIDNTIKYLKEIYNNSNLNSSSNLLKSDYIITTTINLWNIEADIDKVFDIKEGSLESNIGLLVFDESLDLSKYEEILNSKGYKIEEFENTFKCDDYHIYGKFSQLRVARFRRNVLGTYKFSGVNADERSIILILFLIIMIPWAISIGIRINDKGIRRAVIICLSMVLSWLVLRFLKSHFSNDLMQRYIWYFNYLPLIFSPILFLNANMVMTLPQTKKTRGITIFLLSISIILLFLVLTNDIFQFAFVFNKGLDNWNSYSYGFLFYVICLVGFIELLAGIILLIKKNYKQISFIETLAPILIFIFIVAYIACDFIGISFIVEMDYTLIICLFALILWEVTLRAGLVQNCGKYYSLFNTMSFDLAILSKNDEVIYKTEKFGDISNNSTRYSKYDIRNGYTVLKEDLGVLDNVKNELNIRQALLEKNNKTLLTQNKIMSEYYSLQSQNEILNEIDKDYKNKNDQIIELISKIEPLTDKKEIYPYLARIKFLVSYTKQKYNCFLNSKLSDKIEIQTIALAIHIMMKDAINLGLNASLLCNSMELIDSKLSVIILDIIYMMMENAIDNSSDLFSNIDVDDNNIKVFGLYKDNVNIKMDYFSNSVNNLIELGQISYEIKKNDDMIKFAVNIRRDK